MSKKNPDLIVKVTASEVDNKVKVDASQCQDPFVAMNILLEGATIIALNLDRLGYHHQDGSSVEEKFKESVDDIFNTYRHEVHTEQKS